MTHLQHMLEIAAAVRAYQDAEARARVEGTGIRERVDAWLRLYAAFGKPLGEGGMMRWLEHETWATRN